MPLSTPSPLISLSCTFSTPALSSKLNTEDATDNVSNIWAVLTKCKDVVHDGRRLENVCWRLWHQACMNRTHSTPNSSSSHIPHLARPPPSALDPTLDADSDSESLITTDSSSSSASDREAGEEEEEEDWESDDDNLSPLSSGSRSGSGSKDDQSDKIGPGQEVLNTRNERKRGLVEGGTDDPGGLLGQGKGVDDHHKIKIETEEEDEEEGEDGFETVSDSDSDQDDDQNPTHLSLPSKPLTFPTSDNTLISSPTPTSTQTQTTTRTRTPTQTRPINPPPSLPPMARTTTPHSSTPKASSYPTPSTSLADHPGPRPTEGVVRTRSHTPSYPHAARQGPQGRGGQGRMRWDGARWVGEEEEERERSFGQVLKAVFAQRVGRDFPPDRKIGARGVEDQHEERQGEKVRKDEKGKGKDEGPQVKSRDMVLSPLPVPSTGTGTGPKSKSKSPDRSSLSKVPETDRPASHAPPGSQPSSHAQPAFSAGSSLGTNLSSGTGGLEVRVVEPTPVPSRVGSLGDTSVGSSSGQGGNGNTMGLTTGMTAGMMRPPGHSLDLRTGEMRREGGEKKDGHKLKVGGSRTIGLAPMSTIHSNSSDSHSASRTTSSSSSGTDSSTTTGDKSGSSPVYSPQIEKEDPMAAEGKAQAQGATARNRRGSTRGVAQSGQPLSTSALRKLGESQVDPTTSSATTGNGTLSGTTLHSSASRKKDKKSIFFIHSPGERRRQGSVSAMSDGSTETGSTVADSSVGTTTTTTRLPCSPRPRSVGRPGTSPLAGPVSTSTENESVNLGTTDEPVLVASPLPLSTVPEALTAQVSPTDRPDGSRRRSSGSSRGPVRRASGETKPTMTKMHPAHAQVQRSHAPKRIASASNMQGKFAGEKAKAAAAIAARLEAQQQHEKEKQQEARNKILAAKRQRSEPDFAGAQARAAAQKLSEEDGSFETVDEDESGDDDAGDDDEGWSSATDSPKKGKASAEQEALTFGGKGKGKAALVKAIKSATAIQNKAEDEAQRKRELFAKRAIFGNSGQSTLSMAKPAASESTSAIPSRPGLLSNLFETQRDVLQRGESMADLTQPAPKAATSQASPAPGMSYALNRSKSAAAIPAMTGVSIGRGGMMEQVAALEANEGSVDQREPARGKFRLPPKPVNAADLSPSSSPEEETSVLKPSSVALRRLEEISGRRQQAQRSSSKLDVTASDANPSIQRLKSGAVGDGPQTSDPSTAQPMPAASAQPPQPDLALPQTPTTRRRQMLATELPEDLRLNLIWERRSRAPQYPIRKNSELRSTASAHDLPETARQAEQTEPSAPPMSRQQTEPVAGPDPDTTNLAKRRPSHNLLSGGNLLRPLTSAATSRSSQQLAQREGDNRQPPTQSNLANNRSKSSADMTRLNRQSSQQQPEPADLTRRMTDGEPVQDSDWIRNRRLRLREGELSSSFRSHGW